MSIYLKHLIKIGMPKRYEQGTPTYVYLYSRVLKSERAPSPLLRRTIRHKPSTQEHSV